jgi:hypothetical protein
MQVVKTVSCLFSSLALLIGIASPMLAQTTQTRPLEEFTRPQEAGRDPFTGNNGSGMFDLIHRANLGGLKDNAQFQQEQRQNLNNAASDFRSRQLELLRSPQQSPQLGTSTGTSAEPVTTPASN